MNDHHLKLIKDNPNLSHESLARLINVHRNTIYSYRKSNNMTPRWFHSGNKIPFFTSYLDKNLVNKSVVKFGKKKVHEGSFSGAMINVDRLINCLESNSRHLLKTLKQHVFDDLTFIKGK